MNRFWTRALLSSGMAFGAVAIVGGIVYAAAWGPAESIPTGTTTDVRFHGHKTFIVIGANSANSADPGGNKDLFNETFLYVSPTLAGFASSIAPPAEDGEARGEILINRVSESNDASDAWIKSDSDAKVAVQSDGDVVITLGN
jgi:hypothetical protein